MKIEQILKAASWKCGKGKRLVSSLECLGLSNPEVVNRL